MLYLQGGEILTQTTAESSKDSDSDEESLPADDDDSEVVSSVYIKMQILKMARLKTVK